MYWMLVASGKAGPTGHHVRHQCEVSVPLLKTMTFSIGQSLGDPDDDVRAAAASVLLPVVDGLVSSLPDTRLLDLLNILSACLSELGDDLSSSVGNIMDLLAEMLRHTRVLDLLQGQSQG